MRTLRVGTALLVMGLVSGCGDDSPSDASATTTGVGGAGGSPAGGGGLGAGGEPTTGEGGFSSDYEACLHAQNQVDCEAVGGTWTTIGPFPDEACQCPTHQEDMPCTMQTQCLSACIAMPTDGLFGCEGVETGHCSPVAVTVGCWCFFDQDGVVTGLCVD